MEALGVVTGGHHECGHGVGTDPEQLEEVGDGGDEQCLDPFGRARGRGN
jgi:hypothetical protein